MGVKEDPPDPFSDDIQEMNENYVSTFIKAFCIRKLLNTQNISGRNV